MLSKINKYLECIDSDDSNFFHHIKDRINGRIVIYGASTYGKLVLDSLSLYTANEIIFVDGDLSKEGGNIKGYKIYSYRQYKEIYLGEDLILIASHKYEEIEKILKEDSFSYISLNWKYYRTYFYKYFYREDMANFKRFLMERSKDFENVYSKLADEESKKFYLSSLAFRYSGNLNCICISEYEQYIHPIVRPIENDTIVDAGAYIGDTAEMFNKFLHNKCKIYSFEPFQANYEYIENWIKKSGLKNVLPYPYGLGEKDETLYMSSEGDEIFTANKVTASGDMEISVINLSDFFLEKVEDKIHFIKMDIEGSELSALKGAQKLLNIYKPKLAICIYHSNKEMLEIPLFLMENFKDYDFYVGHHSDDWTETVIYGVLSENYNI